MKTPDQHGGGLEKDATPSITPERLQQQAEAIEKSVHNSLQRYLDDRLKSRSPQHEGWWVRRRADVYFLVTVVALVLLFNVARKGNSSSGEGTPATDTGFADTTTIPSAATSLMAELIADPDTGFRQFWTSQKGRTDYWLGIVAASQSDRARETTLRNLMNQGAGGSSVSELRDAVFYYAYQRWLVGPEVPAGAFQVMPNTEVNSEALKGLVERLDLQDVLAGTKLEGTDRGLRTAVALRWMQSYTSADRI